MGKIFYTGEEKSLIYRDDKSKIMYKDEEYNVEDNDPLKSYRIHFNDGKYGTYYYPDAGTIGSRYFYKLNPDVYDTYVCSLKFKSYGTWGHPLVLISKDPSDVAYKITVDPGGAGAGDYPWSDIKIGDWYVSQAGSLLEVGRSRELTEVTGIKILSENRFNSYNEGAQAFVNLIESLLNQQAV